MKLGKVLKGWRRDSKLSLRAAAKEVGINYSTLRRLEEGRNIDAELFCIVQRWTLEHDLAGRQGNNRKAGRA